MDTTLTKDGEMPASNSAATVPGQERLRDALGLWYAGMSGEEVVVDPAILTVLADAIATAYAEGEAAAAVRHCLAALPEGSVLPEIRWLKAWCEVRQGEPSQDCVSPAAAERVFGPVRHLLYRALAEAGCRSELARLLPAGPAGDLYHADALLETGRFEAIGPDWFDLVDAGGTLPDMPGADLAAVWRQLLALEGQLATCWPIPDEVGAGLAQVHSCLTGAPEGDAAPDPLAAGLGRHLLARCHAARCRLAIITGGDGPGMVESAGGLLSGWERDYLLGLAFFALGAGEPAAAHLLAAWEESPCQGAAVLALASLPGAVEPVLVERMLAEVAPSREVCIARAAQALRHGADQAAASALALAQDPDTPHIAPRQFSGLARSRYHRQGRALTVVLAERGGRWPEAAAALAALAKDGAPPSLLKAREFFQSACEHRSLAPHQKWRRELLDRKLDRLGRELGRALLTRDALFFWAWARCATKPEEAVKGFRRLLRQRPWVEEQQRAGGERLAVIGDMLLRHNQPEDALLALELAESAGYSGVAGRLRLARTLTGAPQTEASAVLSEGEIPPFSPEILAALQCASSGALVEAVTALPEDHAPLARLLRALAEGKLPESLLGSEELKALDLPPPLSGVVSLLAGPGSWPERVAAYLATADNRALEACPLSPTSLAATWAKTLLAGNDWPQALALADHLVGQGDPALAEVGLLLRLLAALDRARKGDWAGAESLLAGK